MAKRYQLQATRRQQTANAARRSDSIPGVLYGYGIDAMNVQVNKQQFAKIFHQAGSSSLVDITLDDGRSHNVLIREVQHHPVKDHIVHADFYQVRMDQPIRAEVPIHFVGESPAVEDFGGVLVRNLDELDLEALPSDLPHDIEVDISSLTDFEKIVHVSDLDIPKGVKLFHEPGEVVALVQPPRTEEELEQLAEEVSEDVEAVEGIKEEEMPKEGEEETEGTQAKEEKGDQG